MVERSWVKKAGVCLCSLVFIAVLGLGCATDKQMKEIKQHREAAEAAMKAAQASAKSAKGSAHKAEAAAIRAQSSADRAEICAEKCEKAFEKGLRK
ncbi:MAG: hypothetical protein JRI46_03485 [Deltaproteobacteria bacterium]|nr:hypothetical protein [Deltaproteobacteria bacterium]